MTEWNRMPIPAPYVKMDVSRYITLINKLRAAGFTLTREQELRCGNIPLDETEEALMELFFSFLRLHLNGQAIPQPELPGVQSAATLPELELYCRKLDLFFSFSKVVLCLELLYNGFHQNKPLLLDSSLLPSFSFFRATIRLKIEE